MMWLLVGFGLCLGLFFVVAAFAQRGAVPVESDYLAGSRRFGTWVVGLSIAGANNSGFMFLGAVGAGYQIGLAALWWPIGALIGDLVFWAIFPARINQLARERGALTVPQLISGAQVGKAADPLRSVAGLLVFVFMAVYLISQFYAGGKVINAVYPAFPAAGGSFLTAALIVAYVTKGGIRASIWTDVAQALLMIVVAGCCFVYVVVKLGGISSAIQRVFSQKPWLLEPTSGHAASGVLLVVGGFALVALGFGLGQPSAIVRLVAGRTPAAVRNARWIYLTYTYTLWAGMTVFGILMAVHFPSIADPEQAFPLFAKTDLSPFFSGIAIAGIFCAVASTASAQLLVCSSSLAVDISSRMRDWGRKSGLRFQYVVTVIVGMLAAVGAALNEKFSIYSLVLYVTGALGCAIAPAVLIAVMHWSASARSLIAAMIVGTVVSVSWHYFGLSATSSEVGPGIMIALLVNWVLVRLGRR
jgi:sodium/proline symporter